MNSHAAKEFLDAVWSDPHLLESLKRMFLLNFLELDGALIAQFRVPSFAIIEHFNVLENRADCLLSGLELFSVNQLLFQSAEETLGHRIVPTVSLATHADHGSCPA